MQRSSVYTSIGFHVAILLIAILGLPLVAHREMDIPPPITVDLVEISKVAETTQVTPKPAPPKPLPKPEPPKPQPAQPNMAPQPVKPVVTPPVPVEKPPEKTEEVDEAAPPKKEKKEIKKPVVKKEQPQRDFSSVLKNLEVTDKPPPPPPPGQNTPIGQKMTMTEEDALRSQLESCWDVPFGAKDEDNMAVDIVMVINQDRTLQDARVVDTARYNSDSFFRATADSALRAVRSPKCSPFNVPPDKYSVWNTVTVTFNPKDMF